MLAVKTLMRELFNTFPVENVDEVLQLIFEGDPYPLFEIVDELGLPLPIFKLSRAVLMNEAGEAEENVLKMTTDFLPEGYAKLFNGLY